MRKGKTLATVRQFLYLDTEQVRSFVAQIDKGLPEKQERVLVKRSTGGAKGSVKIPTIAEVGIDGRVLWESSSTETLSMHHYLFSIFEEAIRTSQKVIDIDMHTRLATCLDRLKEGSTFVLVRGAVQIRPVERPFIEPISKLVKWLTKQQRKLLKEGVPISETGIVPYMDKMPSNLADELKALIPAESFIVEVSVEKLSLRFRGTLYERNFQGDDSLNVLLTPQKQASSAIVVFGITNTVPIFNEGPVTAVVDITPLAIYREY